MTPPGLGTVRHGVEDLPAIRQVILDVYAEVYATALSEPFSSVQRFDDRLERQISGNRWEIVLGHVGPEIVGYAYGAGLRADTAWWHHVATPGGAPPPAADVAETGRRTFALFELMVRAPWRGTGAARAVHDALLAGRPEERVTLLVDASHPRVRAMYERWGYRYAGETRPFPDAPVLEVMLKPLAADGRDHPPVRTVCG